MKEKFKRYIALFLTLAIILPVQELKVFAETVSKNEVIEEDSNNEQVTNPIEPETVSGGDVGEETFPEMDAAGKEFSRSGVNEEGMPSAPIHHCAPDYTDFSYVYFGSYPQSEVVDSAIIAAIENAISISGAESNADVGIDVIVDDIKYRRISKNDTNYSGYFGNSKYRYFKWEKIRWKVLQNDGATLFVMADMALDCKAYHDAGGDITWEDSSVRSWLNGSFYHTAFNSGEQEAVVEQTVKNEDNPDYGTEGGNDTRDKVYLLSIDEVTKETYGFCSDSDTDSQSRRIKDSDYANARGTHRDGYDGDCWWWLRSPGNSSIYAAYVDYGGDVPRYCIDVGTHRGGVCPALHINLQSDLWSMLDNSTVRENAIQTEGEVPINPIHHCPAKEGITDCTDWNYVYFGSYPQSEVTDSAIITAIENAISTSGAESNADVGIDVWVDGIKYRRISKNDTNYNGYFDEVSNNGYRYFKWEQIKWRVLQNNGSTLFVVADKVVDCKDYNEEYESITWENSTIRNWLNNSFYNAAFNRNEQSAIVMQNIVNEDNPCLYYGTEGGNNTSDNVYLLSISEVTDEIYGFCSDYGATSMSRRMKTSDYGNARGAMSKWWLRSPGGYNDSAAYVLSGGYVFRIGDYVDYNYIGVCPALHINLQSDLWTIADDTVEEEKLLTGIQVSKQKTTYEQGEPLNVDDLKVTAHYQSHPEQLLPAGSYTTNAAAIDMNTPGSKTLTISYTEGTITKTAAITITVNQKTNTTPQAKKGTQITDPTSNGKYTVTSTDPKTPTVSYDGSTDPNAKSVTIPEYITYNGVQYKVTTVSTKSFQETKSSGQYTVTDNHVGNLTVEYTGTTNKNKKTITIPEYVTYQGVKYKVTTVKAKSFKGNKKLTTIKIASSITKIGDNCFEGCTSLKTVTIGTGLKTIGKNAFKNCKNLKTLTIKSSKLKTVGKNAFKGINAKCKIKVPAKKVKAYQKLMKKKGQKPTVRIGK